jgi:hypothetical protein
MPPKVRGVLIRDRINAVARHRSPHAPEPHTDAVGRSCPAQAADVRVAFKTSSGHLRFGPGFPPAPRRFRRERFPVRPTGSGRSAGTRGPQPQIVSKKGVAVTLGRLRSPRPGTRRSSSQPAA